MAKWFFNSKFLLNLAFPPMCAACSRYLGLQGDPHRLCASCASELNLICDEFPHWSSSERGLDGLWSLAPYNAMIVSALLQKLKYQGKTWIYNCLNDVFARCLAQSLFAPRPIDPDWQSWDSRKPRTTSGGVASLIDAIVHIPLHPMKLKARGFNQAELIANTASEVLQKPILTNVLVKNRWTKPQMKIKDANLRRLNVQKSFIVRSGHDILNQRLLLVDDIYTTGSTMAECAKTLRLAGASKIYGLTLARTI